MKQVEDSDILNTTDKYISMSEPWVSLLLMYTKGVEM